MGRIPSPQTPLPQGEGLKAAAMGEGHELPFSLREKGPGDEGRLSVLTC